MLLSNKPEVDRSTLPEDARRLINWLDLELKVTRERLEDAKLALARPPTRIAGTPTHAPATTTTGAEERLLLLAARKALQEATQRMQADQGLIKRAVQDRDAALSQLELAKHEGFEECHQRVRAVLEGLAQDVPAAAKVLHMVLDALSLVRRDG